MARSAQVALDLIAWTHGGLVGILPRFAQRPALPKQVPALIELNLQGPQPLMFLRFVDLVVLQLGPKLLLFCNRAIHLGENVTV